MSPRVGQQASSGKTSGKVGNRGANCGKQRNRNDRVGNRLPSGKKGRPGALTEGFSGIDRVTSLEPVRKRAACRHLVEGEATLDGEGFVAQPRGGASVAVLHPLYALPRPVKSNPRFVSVGNERRRWWMSSTSNPTRDSSRFEAVSNYRAGLKRGGTRKFRGAVTRRLAAPIKRNRPYGVELRGHRRPNAIRAGHKYLSDAGQKRRGRGTDKNDYVVKRRGLAASRFLDYPAVIRDDHGLPWDSLAVIRHDVGDGVR
ncbi:hypothetical protein WN48_11219 [Eufriesea mexicana]|uniref:Uncharacterized protein n=1 Tax=Eufriesea mexicana TaxID=516756 RepID=A0A310SS55_9HYME|nr:hypothetical protein WN48_11219 [Eufriesea mexicana]